jgi:hypothetical protein
VHVIRNPCRKLHFVSSKGDGIIVGFILPFAPEKATDRVGKVFEDDQGNGCCWNTKRNLSFCLILKHGNKF